MGVIVDGHRIEASRQIEGEEVRRLGGEEVRKGAPNLLTRLTAIDPSTRSLRSLGRDDKLEDLGRVEWTVGRRRCHSELFRALVGRRIGK